MTRRRSAEPARRGAHRPGTTRETLATAPPERATRAAWVLWIALAVLAALRAVLASAHGMWLWSLNTQRFVAPTLGWALWALAAVALVPPLARAALPAASRAGDAMFRRPVPASLAWMALAALLVWAFPDRVRFVGDFLLRQGAIEEDVRPGNVFPQALPLDVFLHVRLPALLMDALHIDATHATRLIGAVEAALLALLAVAFARALALRGAAGMAATATVVFGGVLALYSGYSKSLIELALLTGAVALFALEVARDGRGMRGLMTCLACGLLLHRSALGFLPAVAVAVGSAAADRVHRARMLRPASAIAVLLPVAAFVAAAPRILGTLTHGDVAVHLASDEVVRGGGLLATMFAGARAFDLASVVLLLAPLALAAPVALLALGRPPRARELVVLTTLALPFVALLLAVHPAQGMFRDWDDFAETGVALTLVSAWVVGESLRAAPRHAWVAVPLVAGLATGTVTWMAHQSDVSRGLARVRAFVDEPPARTDAERGKTRHNLGIRAYRLERWDDAALAFREAARTVPSPRILTQLAAAELQRGDRGAARGAYERVVARDSSDTFAWTQLAGVAMQQGDTATMRRAANAILRVKPDDPDGLGILRVLAGGTVPRQP